MKAQKGLASMLAELDISTKGIIDLTVVCEIPTNRRLLRYPLLVNAKARYGLYAELRRRGLGSSGMYPATLPGIFGLKELLAGQGPFPAAETFAARILTLPSHSRVGGSDIAEIRRVIAAH
jgi:dTDP-4-amino-4,6-dideoxygalactose transaminase